MTIPAIPNPSPVLTFSKSYLAKSTKYANVACKNVNMCACMCVCTCVCVCVCVYIRVLKLYQ